VSAPLVGRLDPARLQAWLAAAVAGLLVLLYLCVQLTYGAAHLPPPRYQVLAPGAVAHGTWGDFRLLSLTRTDRWGRELDGEAGTAAPGSEWVVAELEVTPRRHDQYMLCTLVLASTDGRSWEFYVGAPPHAGESCVPEGADAKLGATYRIVVGYQVPVTEVDHLAGLGLDPYSWHRYPLLRPPA
jgi:hypothetical protein